jgi:D-3-phosphoglycerate dehydrogenase
MDNIDVDYAKSKGIHVINTPAASSASVAELVFAHLYGGVRFLYNSNRNMPLEGEANFKGLKKAYAKGVELRGKTLGIIGFGRIGQEVAKIGLGVGMKIIASDKFIEQANITVALSTGDQIEVTIKTESFDRLIAESDFISLHVPAQKSYVIDAAVLAKMKEGAGIINAARGGVIDEVALVDALDSGKLSFAALDTFENEPKPEIKLLMHDKISLTPHIGAATLEAQDRIGEELASQIATLLK